MFIAYEKTEVKIKVDEMHGIVVSEKKYVIIVDEMRNNVVMG